MSEQLDEELADFLETSESIFHRDLAHFQLNQHKRYAHHAQEADAWRAKELADKHATPEHLQFIVSQHLCKMRRALHEEMLQYMDHLTQEQAERDQEIMYYVSQKMQSVPHASKSSRPHASES